MSAAPRNLAASVMARLQNEAARRGEDFNLLLLRYGIERLLYRLSRSAHADRFLLKGAMLFVIWDEKTHRPTRDLDLLGFGPSEIEDLQKVFQDVVMLPVADDGLVFDPGSVRAEEIIKDDQYGGVRVRIMGKLGTAKVPVQIDVGVGDVVTPAPDTTCFPPLLDFPVPQVRTYPVYTVVAEKLQAMATLGIANTRMKDFHDLWFLMRRFHLDVPTLRRAIEATFQQRQTPLPVWPEPLGDLLAHNASKQTQWTAFIRRHGLTGLPDRFADVVATIRDYLAPVLRG